MIGVYQDKPANCVSACVASLFEQNLADVPDFDPVLWGPQLHDWLATFDYSFINVNFRGLSLTEAPISGYTLGSITPEIPYRPGWTHCVVCLDGKIVWCPMEGRKDGTEIAEEYTIIYPKFLEIGHAIQK